MKKFLVLCFLCITMFSVGIAQATNYGVINTQERILTLPQDQSTWYVSLFGDTNDPKYHELKSWFKQNKELAKLKRQVHFNEYVTGQVRYERYAQNMPGLPCIRVQNEKGVVTSEFWGTYIPMTSEALYQGIVGDVEDKASWGCLRSRRDRCCPQPSPRPQPPSPPPLPPVGPPDLEPDPEPEPVEPVFPWLLVALAAMIGGLLGFAQSYRAEHLDQPAPRITKM